MSIRLSDLFQKTILLIPWLVMAGLLFYNINFLITSSQLNDYGSFYASGSAARAGRNPYGVYDLTSRAEYGEITAYFPNLNPPISVIIFEGLSTIQPEIGKLALTVLSVILYALTLFPLIKVYKVKSLWIAWAFTLAGFWDTLVLGQIYIPIFSTVAAAWLLLREQKYYTAGIIMGIACAFKLNLLIWPVLLFLVGYRKTAVSAFITTFILSVIPIIRYGVDIYMEWYKAVNSINWLGMPHYASIFSLASRFGQAWMGLPLIIVFLAFIFWRVWKKRPDYLYASATALVSAYLVSPLASPRMALFLVPVFFAWIKNTRIKISADLLLVPTSLIIFFGFQSHIHAVLLGLIYPLALLLLLVEIQSVQVVNEHSE